MVSKIRWKRKTAAYANGENGYLGKYVVFSLDWDSCRSKGAEILPYILRCSLPGIKPNLGNFSQEEAKRWAEEVLGLWVENVGLTFKEV